jgi:iron(III) transport system substrate-binding protein
MKPRKATQVVAFVAMTIFASNVGAEEKSDASPGSGVVNIYSARHYDSDQLLYDEFTRQTGVAVKRVELKPDLLIERMRAEGKASPADVVIMADAGALWRAQAAGLFQPLADPLIEGRVPAQFREQSGRWFGFSRRARVIAYDRSKVKPEEVAAYAQLAAPRFKGKLCVRSSDNVYNQSILGAFIEAWGAEQAMAWAQGMVANMARPPRGGDTDQIKAVAAGACEVALVNTYYYLRIARSAEAADKAVAEKVAISFPDQKGGGTHVNISGGGIALNAPNRDNAVKFLQFLTSEKAQSLFATANNEYPVGGAGSATLTDGPDASFKTAGVPVTVFGKRQAEAQAIFDRVGWR